MLAKHTKIKFILVWYFALLIFSCDLQVVYKDQNLDSSLSYELATIRIKKERDVLSQQLRSNLYDVFNPDATMASSKYFLILDLNVLTSPTFITTTGASGRNKVTLVVKYKLKNIQNMTEISEGKVEIADNYDVSLNRYGTYVAEEYVKNNLTKLLAQNLRDIILNDLVELRKKCQNMPKIDSDSECFF